MTASRRRLLVAGWLVAMAVLAIGGSLALALSGGARVRVTPVMADVAGLALTDEERVFLRHPLVGAVILFARFFREGLAGLARRAGLGRGCLIHHLVHVAGVHRMLFLGVLSVHAVALVKVLRPDASLQCQIVLTTCCCASAGSA